MANRKITREDIQRRALSKMMNEISERGISYTESELKEMAFSLLKNVDRRLNEVFDPSIIDGIDYIPPTEINKLIKNLIGDIYQRKSPFAPIRAIALFFSKDGAIGHTTGAKPIIAHFMKDKDVSKSVWIIQTKIKKLEELVQRSSNSFQLVYEVSYLIDDITNAVQTLMTALNRNYQLDWFRGSETIDGSKDGKRKGLASILIQASMKMQELKNFIDKLKGFADKGKDPSSYWVN